MYVSARTDYAVRAMLAVTAAHPSLVKAAELATAQEIPLIASIKLSPCSMRPFQPRPRRCGIRPRAVDEAKCVPRRVTTVTVPGAFASNKTTSGATVRQESWCGRTPTVRRHICWTLWHGQAIRFLAA